MRIHDVFISRRIADKIWEEHGVSADEAMDLLHGDPMIRHTREGRYMAVDLATGGYLTVIFVNGVRPRSSRPILRPIGR